MHSNGLQNLNTFNWDCRFLRNLQTKLAPVGTASLLILQDSTKNIAMRVGERIRSVIESTPCITGNEKIVITVSAGCITSNNKNPNSESLYRKADEALFEAKCNFKQLNL